MEVKICGMTNREDVMAALEGGADYVGFVLYPSSPRGITPLAAARLLDQVTVPCRAVAVCVNMSRAEVLRVVADCNLFAVQLHGDEPVAEFMDLGLTTWRAVKLVQGEGKARPDPADWPANRYVVDAAVPGMYGGTGETADWDQARRFAARVPTMLAGGLTPGNVAAAIGAVRPLGVDATSGVEASPGRKDCKKMHEFIENAKRSLPAS